MGGDDSGGCGVAITPRVERAFQTKMPSDLASRNEETEGSDARDADSGERLSQAVRDSHPVVGATVVLDDERKSRSSGSEVVLLTPPFRAP
jgi:hypothetical protein